MEGLLHQYEKLQEVYDTMKRLNFDYYFVDIENIDTKNILIEYQRGFTHANTHFENIHFIKNSNIPSTNLSIVAYHYVAFKYTNDGTSTSTSRFSLSFNGAIKIWRWYLLSPFEDDPMFIALFNRHGSFTPIMHLYQFIAAFIDVPIHIANNYLMSQKMEITILSYLIKLMIATCRQ